MIVHYNIKSDPKHWHGMQHIAIFYLGDCEPMDLMKAADLIKTTMDASIGTVFYLDWDYVSEQGTIRVESKMGCDIEAIRESCNKIIELIQQQIH